MDITLICAELKNYFPPANQKSDKSYIHKGCYSIKNGSIAPLDFIKEQQYFRIVGSDLNDGVYQNTPESLEELLDEDFTGSVWAMSVPRYFIKLCNEIQRFNEKVDEMALVEKGYASESYGGYSYSLSSSAPAGMVELEKRINRQLCMYRRISVL